MILSGRGLLGILAFFFGGIFWIIFFVQKQKYLRGEKLAKEMGFLFFNQTTLPAEFDFVSKNLRYFWGYEYLLIGNIANKKVFFTQYLQKMASQLPYMYAVFVLFEKLKVFSSDEERKNIQIQIDQILGGAVVTESGVFYYHPIPWTVNKKVLLPIMEKLVEVMKVIE
jgi:hypothetical protein